MDYIRIQYLYCHCGWTVDRIASALSESATVIQMAIDKHGWKRNETANDVISLDEGDNLADKTVEALRNNEIQKQHLIAPLAAVTEMALLSKLAQAISNVDAADPASINALNSLTKSFATLTANSVSANVASTQENNQGVHVQVVTQIM